MALNDRLLKIGTAVEQPFANHTTVQDRGHKAVKLAESPDINIYIYIFLYLI